jgi:molybdopterin converting factor small subunit
MRAEDTPSPLQSSGETSRSLAMVRLMGNLGKLPTGKKVESETVFTPISVGNLLLNLRKTLGIDLSRDSTLILVNGVEANALQDLETVVVAGDEVALVPMFHGGSG